MILSICLILFYSCQNQIKESSFPFYKHEKVQWNVLVYLAGDSELESYAINNVLEMRSVGSNEYMNVLVLLDRSPGFDSRFGNWQGTKLFRLRKGDGDFIEDEIYDFGELDMKSPDSLDLFLRFANQYFPSEHTLLSLWSHGFGIYPDGAIQCFAKKNRSLISDYTTDFKIETSMTIQSLSDVLSNYDVDIVHFDACNMAMTEVIWELANYTRFVVSSQLAVPSGGMNYKSLLMTLVQNPFTTPEEFAYTFPSAYSEKYKDTNYSYSLSCVSVRVFDEFKTAFEGLCENLENISNEEADEIFRIRKRQSSISPDYEEYIDLCSFFNACSESSKISNALQENFHSCKRKLQESIVFINDPVTASDIYGLSINFPVTEEQLSKYSNLTFPELEIYRATKFNNFIIEYIDKEKL